MNIINSDLIGIPSDIGVWTELHAKRRMQLCPNNFRSDVFLDANGRAQYSNDQTEMDKAQISWTERHEALFMSFCPGDQTVISCYPMVCVAKSSRIFALIISIAMRFSPPRGTIKSA